MQWARENPIHAAMNGASPSLMKKRGDVEFEELKRRSSDFDFATGFGA
jgi:hypothetical protein